VGIGMNEQGADLRVLLNVEEVARLLRVPKSWVYEHTLPRSNPRLPHIRLGKYLRFRLTDLHEFMAQASQKGVAHGRQQQ